MEIVLEVSDKFAVAPKDLQESAKQAGIHAIESRILDEKKHDQDIQRILDFEGFVGTSGLDSTDIIRQDRERADGRTSPSMP